MASIAIMAGGALVNALAFSGTNFIFGQLGDHGGTEMKRHNLAVEKLSKAREEYSKERQQRLDYLNKTISQQKHAERTFGDLNAAMREYHEGHGSEQLPPLRDEPKLSDFYNPSRDGGRDAEIALVVGGMAVVGLLAYEASVNKTMKVFELRGFLKERGCQRFLNVEEVRAGSEGAKIKEQERAETYERKLRDKALCSCLSG